jgi:hypothetical protein
MKVELASTDIIIMDEHDGEVWIPLEKIPALLQSIAKLLEEEAERSFDRKEAKLEY